MIGPIPYLTRKHTFNGKEYVTFVPDYSKPGVKERINEEVKLAEDYREWRNGL